MGIALADVEDVLALFCEGMSGRSLHIKPLRELVSRRFALDQDSFLQAPDALYMPESLDSPDRYGYHVLALEQIGYGEFGTYDFSLDVFKNRVPGGFFCEPEVGARESLSDLQRFFSAFEQPGLAQRLFHLIEHARVFAHLFRVYPGLLPHANRYFAYCENEDADAEDVCAAASARAAGFPPALLRRSSGLARAVERVRQRGSDVYDTAINTTLTYPGVASLLFTGRSLNGAPDGDDDFEAAPSTQQTEVALEDPGPYMQVAMELDRLEAELKTLDAAMLIGESSVDIETTAGSGEFAGEVRPEGLGIGGLEGERDQLKRQINRARASVTSAFGPDRDASTSFRYDEWDHLERRYRRRWCRLYEEPLSSSLLGDRDLSVSGGWDQQKAAVEPLREVIKIWRPAVQAKLERIRPLGKRRVSPLADGDELEIDAIITARQEIRACRQPDERVYSRREKAHRDLSTLFLVDLSASTGDPLEVPAPHENQGPTSDDLFYGGRDWMDWAEDALAASVEEPIRTVLDVQREAIAVVAAALNELGDQFGIYGFSGYGRDCVEVFVVKELNALFTQATLAALTNLKPKRSTRMGPVIRHAVRRLTNTGSALKVLIVISDGFPQDTDYGPHRGDHEYGVQDTAKALAEAQAKGVETFCLTVDRSGHDYLRRMCPSGRYMVIDEIEDLPHALSSVYMTLTGR